jgi:APA family basic amino acid/polyamine antiporter
MFGLGLSNWLRLFGWMGVGLIVYFTYSRKRSITSHTSGWTSHTSGGG